MVNKELSVNSEKDSNEFAFSELAELGDQFDREAAEAARAEASESKNSKETAREHFSESIEAANQYIEEMDELLNSGSTDNERINYLAQKIADAINEADKNNKFVKDEEYTNFRSQNEFPIQ